MPVRILCGMLPWRHLLQVIGKIDVFARPLRPDAVVQFQRHIPCSDTPGLKVVLLHPNAWRQPQPHTQHIH